uniref:hypothetical protein n=1 Tax=Sphingobacterium sp. UBA5996 TaxID=1947505 RepID=UPI0025EFF335
SLLRNTHHYFGKEYIDIYKACYHLTQVVHGEQGEPCLQPDFTDQYGREDAIYDRNKLVGFYQTIYKVDRLPSLSHAF